MIHVRKKSSQIGFSLIELMVLLAIVSVVASVALLSVKNAAQTTHIDTAVQMTLEQLRAARQMAIDQRLVTTVTLSTPGTVTVTSTAAGVTSPVVTLTLPSDVAFDNEPGIPSSSSAPPTTPDGFGAGACPIDFDQGFGPCSTVVNFLPDGSGRDLNGNFNNGVVYLAHPGALQGSRAISFFGATGRMKAWRLVQSGGAYSWQ